MNRVLILFFVSLTILSCDRLKQEIGQHPAYQPQPPTKGVLKVYLSAGGEHTCALKGDNLKCWGRNDEGQLNVPKLVAPKMISAGWLHTCALDTDGVKCWGENYFGQSNVPRLVSPIMVSAGWLHTCALDTKEVVCWGDTQYGKTNVPKLVAPTMVSAGRFHTCALDSEGVKCWGSVGARTKKAKRMFHSGSNTEEPIDLVKVS